MYVYMYMCVNIDVFSCIEGHNYCLIDACALICIIVLLCVVVYSKMYIYIGHNYDLLCIYMFIQVFGSS